MRTPPSPLLTIEHALLGFVYEHPAHGYEIHQQMAAQSGLGQVWRIKQGQLYALLAKLEENGLLAADRQAQESRPPRKIYTLTADGCAAFLAWRNSPVARGRQMRSEFLAKFYFACRQDPTAAESLLTQQSAACTTWLADLHGQAQRQAPPSSQQEIFAYAVQQFRINQVESFLAWLATCRQALGMSATKNAG